MNEDWPVEDSLWGPSISAWSQWGPLYECILESFWPTSAASYFAPQHGITELISSHPGADEFNPRLELTSSFHPSLDPMSSLNPNLQLSYRHHSLESSSFLPLSLKLQSSLHHSLDLTRSLYRSLEPQSSLHLGFKLPPLNSKNSDWVINMLLLWIAAISKRCIFYTRWVKTDLGWCFCRHAHELNPSPFKSLQSIVTLW